MRQSDLRGIEASAEIQTTARKVADENRKLRGLLSLQGIENDRVEAYLQSSAISDTLVTSQIPSQNAHVRALHDLLQKSKSLCSDGNIQAPMTALGKTDGGRRALASASTTQSHCDLHQFPESGALQHTDQSKSHKFLTPSTTASSAISSVGYHSHHSAPQTPRASSWSASPHS